MNTNKKLIKHKREKGKESPTSLFQKVYYNIKDQIVTLKLLPGQNLLEDTLRSEFNVSRTPVRMALCKLEQEGFVSHRPNYGYFVRDMRLNHIQSLFQLREFLEVPAVRLACQHATEEELNNFQNFVKEIDDEINSKNFEAAIKMGVEFHHRIAIMSKNEILCDLIRGLNEKISMVARMILQSEQHMIQSHAEHKNILKFMSKRDAEKAADLMQEHVCESSKRFMQILKSKMELLTVAPAFLVSTEIKKEG